MPDEKKNPSAPNDELHNEDFQSVLKALLAAYQPVLKQELKFAGDAAELSKEAETGPPKCEDEIARANQIFGAFFTDEVALKMLPAEARKVLGPVEQWRWCLQHIRCCIIFGWLACRGPRNFRAFSYYLYQYWLCVRQTLGTPVSSPPAQQERADFSVLVEELAGAFKPYLTDQLATVEFPAGISDEVISGAIDCREGLQEACEIFERALTPRAAEVLLGKDAFTSHSREPSFWFCRCWCLCAICFGCCLARARSLREALWCLIYFFRCLQRCFGPLTCNLTDPHDCVAEVANPAVSAYVVEVRGTASGGDFNHYILEWSTDDIAYNATDFIYPPLPPGNPGPGNAPVVNGLLADFNTTFKDAGVYYIRMTVFSNTQAQQQCKINFQLFKKDVAIRAVDNYFNLDTGWTDPAAKFIENVPKLCSRAASVSEVSFGGDLSVQGGAWVGGCSNGKIKSYFLDYKAGFESNCNAAGWTNFLEIDFDTAAKLRDVNMRKGTDYLTAYWGTDCFLPGPAPWCAPPFFKPVPDSLLYPDTWASNIGGCQLNGLYTFRLRVVDTNAVVYCDTQSLWIDNKYPCGAIRIDAVPKCADLFISQFAKPPDCNTPWALPLSGIAFDPLIDELALPSRPNNNFDYYYVQVEKQGGPTVQIPIPGADFDPMNPCFYGTSTVGDPLHHCAGSVCDPNNLDPMAIFGPLASFDLRALDPICRASVKWGPDPNLTIPRGECCVYIFKVWVYDRTLRGGSQHTVWGYADWPVKICNDLSS